MECALRPSLFCHLDRAQVGGADEAFSFHRPSYNLRDSRHRGYETWTQPLRPVQVFAMGVGAGLAVSTVETLSEQPPGQASLHALDPVVHFSVHNVAGIHRAET